MQDAYNVGLAMLFVGLLCGGVIGFCLGWSKVKKEKV
jgi:Na+/glutamate symporter